jgi:hypothetical protein
MNHILELGSETFHRQNNHLLFRTLRGMIRVMYTDTTLIHDDVILHFLH